MNRNNPYDLHDHAGWRWLGPFAAAFAVVIGMAVLMMLYPYTTV